MVEALLAGATFALLATAFAGAFLYGEEATMLSGNRTRAALLAEEGLEAARNVRDSAYSNLADGTYGLSSSSGSWAFSGASDTTGLFTRSLTIATVSSNRKQLTSTVNWQQNEERNGSVSLTSYLTNWLRLGSDWSSPSEEASLDMTGSQNGLKLQVVGNYVYMIRDDSSPDFLVIDVTTPSSPSLIGSLTLTGAPANIYVSGSYAYIASAADSQELQIVSIATPSAPTLTGSYNAPGSTNATGVYVSGSYAYLTRNSSANDELSVINVSTPSAPTLSGSVNLGADATEVVVSGTNAFISSGDNSQELKVVSVATPSAPVQIGSLDLSGGSDGNTIALSGSTVYLGQGATLRVIDVTTPALPTSLGSLALGGTVNDLALNLGGGGSYVFAATSSTTAEFQVVNVATPSAPTVYGSVNLPLASPLLGLDYSSTLDRVFGAGQADTREFEVFKPL